ncbi:hypothetical protein CWB72_05560 [Pseudoalteromonas phenolica]|uniref:hypothetical protein n=1 Tax=Pseudoalteromonas phenolica TaxID=161398 RepID=UPI00110B4B9D|nr:hypothetical protein [Pseudoalteromonas phenolica]TMN92351.1 hypothetical protein CWB72_05560 [Pseudoalteromonas phenolica]
MFNFLRVMLFFPSVNFSLLKAEIFPYAGIYYLLKRPVLYREQLFFIVVLFVSPIYGMYIYNDFNSEVLRSILAYLNPFLIFFTIYFSSRFDCGLIVKIIKLVFYFLVFLSFFQYTGLANLFGFDLIIDLLMSRGNAGVMGHGRGISLLSSEPSRAGMEFLFIYAAFRFCYLSDESKRVVYDLLVLFIIVFLIRSATGAIYSFIFFGLIYKRFSIIAFPVFVFFSVNYLSFTGVRTLDIASNIFANANFSYFMELLLNTSGFRAISVYSGYLSGFYNPFGLGVGFWEYSSLEALINSGVSASQVSFFTTWNNGEYYSVRPTSYVASIMLDMGLLGLLAFIMSFKRIFSKIRTEKELLPIGIVFLFYLFCLGTIGNPIPWVCVALIYSYRGQCGN